MLSRNKFIIDAHKNFLKELKTNNIIKSISLSSIAVTNLKDIKYNLSDFEAYKFIKVSDYLWYNGKFNLYLSAGINSNWNKFKNILVDSFYQDIPNEMFYEMSISSLFKFNYTGPNNSPSSIDISKLKEWDLQLLEINYVKNNYDSYFGNYYTYATFKELIKKYFEEIDLYYYKGNIYSESQLENNYNTSLRSRKNKLDWYKISKLDSELVILKYQILSVSDPVNILTDSLSKIRLSFKLQTDFVKNDDKYNSFYIKTLNLKDLWIKN